MTGLKPLSLQETRRRIDAILDSYRQHGGTGTAIRQSPGSLSDMYRGKLYEALVLVEVLERLHDDEGYSVALTQGSAIFLRSSPGPIDPSYVHFELTRRGGPPLAVWTDVEFLGISHRRTVTRTPGWDEYHELDIVVVPRGIEGRPKHSDVKIGVECKCTTKFHKHMLRAALGVRRELSLLTPSEPTGFQKWPADSIPANPPSCLMVYATDRRVADIRAPGSMFGIRFTHFEWPT
jgi:hypothetical protein